MTHASYGSRVLNLGDENIPSANIPQIIHDLSLIPIGNHDTDGDPVLLVEGIDSWGAPAGGDLCGSGESGTVDVVGAEDVLLGGDDALDAGADALDELRVGGVLGGDEPGACVHYR